jgi:hypothetical protein
MAHSTRLAERIITVQHLIKTYAREMSKAGNGLAIFNKEVSYFQHLIGI